MDLESLFIQVLREGTHKVPKFESEKEMVDALKKLLGSSLDLKAKDYVIILGAVRYFDPDFNRWY